jgi:hypothetical protein
MYFCKSFIRFLAVNNRRCPDFLDGSLSQLGGSDPLSSRLPTGHDLIGHIVRVRAYRKMGRVAA